MVLLKISLSLSQRDGLEMHRGRSQSLQPRALVSAPRDGLLTIQTVSPLRPLCAPASNPWIFVWYDCVRSRIVLQDVGLRALEALLLAIGGMLLGL